MPSPAVECPACGDGFLTQWDRHPEFLRCPACGLGRRSEDPLLHAGSAYGPGLFREPDGDRFGPAVERLERFFRRSRANAILRRFPGPGAILDVGCGRAGMLRRFRERGWKAVGVEIDPETAGAVARRTGLPVIAGELPEIVIPGGPFDVITFFHVLEHTDDPERYLARARELLSPGGLLVVEVPNFDTLGFRVLGSRNLCFDPPHHVHFFSPRSLERMLLHSGFVALEWSHFSIEYSPFTTLQNMLNLLPGEPNRLFASLRRRSVDGTKRPKRYERWAAFPLAALLATPALVYSTVSALFGRGNTMRVYCRKNANGAIVSEEP